MARACGSDVGSWFQQTLIRSRAGGPKVTGCQPDRPRPLRGRQTGWSLVEVVGRTSAFVAEGVGFAQVLERAEVIEEHELGVEQVKELVLPLDWVRPLHVVVVVDDAREEERIVTVYEPEADRWTDGYRRRR